MPYKYECANTVYNYGGSTLDCLPDGRIIFSNVDDTVKVLNPNTGEVTDLTGNSHLRYSDFSANDTNAWVVANEEDHAVDTPEGTRNRVVVINSETGKVNRVVDGPDFVWVPQFSHDGTKIAWLEWDHPDMPWYGMRLFWASFNPEDGTLYAKHLVIGGLLTCVVEPQWGPDGSLFFALENESNYRQLYQLKPGSRNARKITGKGLENAEFGELRWMQGARTYAPLSSKTVAATAYFNGLSQFIAIDLETLEWRRIADDSEANQIAYDSTVRLNDHSVVGIFAGERSVSSVRIIDTEDASRNKLIRSASELVLPNDLISEPKLIHVSAPTESKRDIFGFLWLPKNPSFTGPEGTLPPLILNTHGGPTGHFSAGLLLKTQYFTSRGYAVMLLNYTGSTGHGRNYRQGLWGNWGLVDAADAAYMAEHLVKEKLVREGSLGCTGLSAGGYNTLQSITRHPKTWAGAVDVSGICALEGFNSGTHKLEWNYTDALVIDTDGVSDGDKLKVYRERSALYHPEKVQTPLLILHGKDDTVVPLNQATDMAEALERLGKEVKLVEVDDDGHMLAKPPSAHIWLDEEEKWWRKTLLEKE